MAEAEKISYARCTGRVVSDKMDKSIARPDRAPS